MSGMADTGVRVAMIAAVAKNGVIGRDGGMPWRLPSDMAFFKRTTMGKPVLMGRKQYETVGRALPGRTNIVVSRQKGFQPDGVEVFSDFDAALARAVAVARADGAGEAMIIGGGEIYALGLVHADRLYITHVDAAPEGDTVFPPVEWAEWSAVGGSDVTPTERDSSSFTITIYDRLAGTR